MTRRIAAFIRHADYQQLADTPSALQPFALTEQGIAQARQAAMTMRDFLQAQQWQLDTVIQTSSSLRAWQTASIFKTQLADLFAKTPQLVSDDALTERSVGCAANLTVSQVEQVIQDDPRLTALPKNWKSDSRFRLPLQGAESLMEAGERVAQYITTHMQLMERQADVQVKLFFGHGASFRHAAHILGVLDIEQVAALSMHHAQAVYIEYCDGGSWQHVAGDWKVRSKQGGYTD